MTSVVATRWSRELQSCEFKELQANCMGLSPRGDVAVLAGRKYLAVVDVDVNFGELVARAERASKWDAACVSFGHGALDGSGGNVALASNNNVELWRLGMDGRLDLRARLRAHARAVTDLDWCPSGEDHLLASCSIDTYLFVWDSRDARSQRKAPVVTFSAMNAASQVKWCPGRAHVLASAHEGDVRLWDTRQPTGPFQYIAAHPSKIHGLDWDPRNFDRLVTSSQDQTCKVFDVRDPRKPEVVVNAKYPAWRSKFVPFGNGIVTATVPARWFAGFQTTASDSNSLVLWSLGRKGHGPSQVHTFMGHTDVILDFDWKRSFSSGSVVIGGNGNGNGEEEALCWIVSWSKDNTLRFWAMDAQMEKLLDSEPISKTTRLEVIKEDPSPPPVVVTAAPPDKKAAVSTATTTTLSSPTVKSPLS